MPTAGGSAGQPIAAPWDGLVLRSHVRVEGREVPVPAQALLLELFDPDSVVLRFAVDGMQALGLAPGQSVLAALAGAPSSPIELTIMRA
ncbi:MAG: HlyD family efflux transporter periplasmic adaptor subunit [Gammaproteobacteria bacterium]|nr:HlyD family efflux transporter periplasmic adaptor subunit [Gammaproteobacteria bacterium]